MYSVLLEMATGLPEFRALLLEIFFPLAWYFDLLKIGSFVQKQVAQQQPQAASLLPLVPYVIAALYVAVAIAVLRFQRTGRYSRAFALVQRILREKTPASNRPFFGASAVLTGGNAGIGFENATQLAALGFRVVMVCRSPERGAAARAKILAADPDADVRLVIGDMSDLSNMKKVAAKCVQSAKAGGAFFSLLVANAGFFSPDKRMNKQYDVDEVLLTNHLGTFLFTELCRKEMESFSADEAAFRRSSGELSRCSGSTTTSAARSEHQHDAQQNALGAIPERWRSPRIVVLSSAAHTWATAPRFNVPECGFYDSASEHSGGKSFQDADIWKGLEKHRDRTSNMYGISKACNAMHARWIAMQEEEEDRDDRDGGAGGVMGTNASRSRSRAANPNDHVVAVSVHPGFVLSSIWTWMDAFPAMRMIWDNVICALSAKHNEAGSQTTLHCCIDDGIESGCYFAECAVFTASSVVRDDFEVRAMEAWTQKMLKQFL